MSANNLEESLVSQSFADVIVKTPLTMTLLVLVSTIAILFGLHSVDDRAMMLASGAAVPIRVTLWQREQSASTQFSDTNHIARMNLLSSSPFIYHSHEEERTTANRQNYEESEFAKGLVDDEANYTGYLYKKQEKKQKAVEIVWMLVMCATRFALASMLVTTSGELLISFAALFFITRPLEKLVRTRRCVWLFVLCFLFHALYFIFVFLSFAHWRTINYRMQPGLSWLNVSLYIIYERLASSIFYSNNRSGNNNDSNNFNSTGVTIDTTNNIAQTNSTAPITTTTTSTTSSRFSRLRLYGKIPIGPETVRAVVFVHLLFRGDVLMSTLPACLVGLLFPLSFLHGLTSQEEVSLLNSN